MKTTVHLMVWIAKEDRWKFRSAPAPITENEMKDSRCVLGDRIQRNREGQHSTTGIEDEEQYC